MESSSQFASVPISNSRVFSWVFFVDWFLTFSLAIGMIFYFPRFCGAAISWFLKMILGWRFNLTIDVQSVKFSFLGGRISFRNLVYIDNDQTICAFRGSLTWRYWLPNCRRKDVDVYNEESVDAGVNSKLPCRYLLEIEGLEYFIYNRTVAYDNILKAFNDEFSHDEDEVDNTKTKEGYDVFSSSGSGSGIGSASATLSNSDNNPPNKETAQDSQKPSVLSMLYPLQIQVVKGGLVMGNKTTHAVLIASFNSIDGSIDLGKASSSLDGLSEIYTADIDRLEVSLKPNVLNEIETNGLSKIKREAKKWNTIRKYLQKAGLFRDKAPTAQVETWKGLARYLGEDSESIPDLIEDDEFDYAKYTSILVAERCNVRYVADYPGTIPLNPQTTSPFDGIDVGNGGSPPRNDLSIQLTSGTIHYGPWADRQRHTLQQMVSPTVCRDSVPQARLSPGMRRIFTNFTINIEVVDDLIMRLPTREVSKDEEFKNRDQTSPSSIRPFGWIELKVSKESNISLCTSTLASPAGYENRLDITFFDLEARSSVNHDIFLKCKEHTISSDIGYPLSWNGHTTWSLFNRSSDVETFLLREHITLISDLFSDFGSGDPTPYELFRPFTYAFDWKIDGYKLYFNINDANIINNPLDFNDNVYLSLQGDSMKIFVNIPLDSIIRKSTTVDYNIETPGFSLVLDSPPWHTLNNFLKSKEVGRSKKFELSGAYTYYPELGLDTTDTVIIACTGEYVVLECYGFVVKYIMSIKENYFGDFTRFRTLEEYTTNLGVTEIEEENSSQKGVSYVHKRIENETDVHFSFCIKDSCAVLPSNLYDASSNVALPFESLDIDIRFTNYYMDMQVDSSPIKGYFLPKCDSSKLFELSSFQFEDAHDLSIDLLSIHGHRMFGLPPDEPTCFCKWDIIPGDIVFDGSVEALHGLLNSVVKLGFGYSNLENQLDLEEPELWDTTSLNIHVPKIDFTFRESGFEEKINLLITSLDFKFIDITNFRFTNKIDISLDEISLNIMNTNSKEILLDFKTSLRLTDFCLKKDYQEVKRKQDEHIIIHDGPFHRVPFLIDNELKLPYDQSFRSIIPGFSIPNGSAPLNADTADILFDELGMSSTSYDDYSLFDTDDGSSDFSVNNDDEGKQRTHPKTYKDTISGIYEKPLIDYNDDEFSPTFKADPEFETDNFILNFGNIDIDLCLESIVVILKFIEKGYDRDLASTLDDLHVAVLKRLKSKFSSDLSVKNFRFVTPVITLNITNLHSKQNTQEICREGRIGCILNSPSVVFSVKEKPNGSDDVSLALHLALLEISFNRSDNIVSPLKISLEDLETWTSKQNDLTFSLNLKSIDVRAHSPSLNWLLSFAKIIFDYSLEYELLIDRIKTKSKCSQIELVHRVALASSKFNIVHDSPVITRPAYVIRLSKKHIRSYDSWNIMIRLRHIFDNLPQEWLTTDEYKTSEMSSAKAMGDVLNVFRQWRSWEFSDIADSFIFKYVFSYNPTSSEELDTSADIIISKFSISCFNDNNDESFFKVTDFTASAAMEVADFTVQNTNEFKDRLTLQISEIKSDLSPLSLGLDSVIIPNFGLEASPVPAPVPVTPLANVPDVHEKLNHILIIIDKTDLSINLEHTSYRLRLDQLSSSLVTNQNLDKLSEGTIFNMLNKIGFETYSRNELVLKYTIHDINMIGTFSEDSAQDVNLLNCSSESTTVDITGTGHLLNRFITGLEQDINSIKQIIPDTIPTSNVETTSESSKPSFPIQNLKVKVLNKKFIYGVSLLDPLLVKGSNEQFEMGLILKDDTISVNFALLRSSLEIDTSNQQSLLRSTSNLFSLSSTYVLNENSITISLSTGDTSFMISDAPFTTEHLFNDLKELNTNRTLLTNSITNIAKSFGNDSESISQTIPNTEKPSLVIKDTMINNRSLSIGIYFDNTLFSIDFSEFNFQYFNFVLGSKPNPTWPYGEMSVASTKLKLKSRDIGTDNSTLIDFHFGTKITNTTRSDHQTLEVQSDYSRVLVTPVSFAKLIGLGKALNYLKYQAKMTFPTTVTDPTKESPQKSAADIWKELGFSSIHILSYNVCLGFIFSNTTSTSPGLIVGCEKVFAITEGSLGKLTSINGYLSLARGNKSDTFYSIGNEFSRPNRVFLPYVQVKYAISHIENKDNVMVDVSGGQLDLKLITSSIIFVEQLINSGTAIENLLKKQKKWNIEEMVSKSAPTAASADYSLPSNLTSIRCEVSFAGTKVRLTRWEDFNDNDPYAPSFELRTPAVNMITEYTKSKNSHIHFINFEVFTYSSNNKLHSTCVPILYDVWKTVKYFGKHKKRHGSFQAVHLDEAKKSSSPSSTTSLQDLLKMFHNFHIQFVVHIDKQELTLSCEPSAKVQAVVGIEGIDINIGTSQTEDEYPLSGAISVGAISTSLQHSFSRAVSASFMIDEILITAMLTGTESFRLYTTAGFGKVKSYLYLKQLQDVDLFLDLWKFSDFSGVSSESVKSYQSDQDKQGMSEGLSWKKFQRVSDTALIPWDIYLTVRDLDFEIDLGQSLGVLSLNFDRININSRQESSRRQELLLQFETVSLTSKGRLGGHLIVRDIQTRSLINWSIVGDTYDIPIVLLSFGFSSVELKASFDYNVFLIGKIRKIFLSVYNQVDETKQIEDRLASTSECESIEIFITSFAASNIMDVYNTLVRIRQDNKTSYNHNLQSGAAKTDETSYKTNSDIIDVLAKLRTELNVNLRKCLVHIYPGSLLDSQVLVIKLNGLDAAFQQHSIKEQNKIETDLNLVLNHINIALSSFKSQLPEKAMVDLSIDDFITNSSNASGGNIFTFPALNCSMKTFIRPKSTLVEYIYNSSFGGKVDIRWNLGSINFIREMWMIHVKALSSRLPKDSSKTLQEGNGDHEEKVPLFLDENLDEKIRDVTLGDKYQYIPLEKPNIELPKLKELGDATPPLEWFGLNRQNFPGLTHQFVIFSLQKLVQEVETQYAWVLGKA